MRILFILLAIAIIAILVTRIILRTMKNSQEAKKRASWLGNKQNVVLMIEVPRHNDKTPLAAEQMFASLHGIFQGGADYQEHVSFEIVAHGSSIKFYCFCPVSLRDFVEGQIYAQYPSVEIVKVEDYTRAIDPAQQHTVGTELEMTKADVYPIKTFANFTVDPLAGITAPLSRLQDNEQVWIQILARPVDDSWQARGTKLIESVRSGTDKPKPGLVETVSKGVVSGVATLAVDVVREATSPGSIKVEGVEGGGGESKLAGPVESALKGVEEKITKLGFATKIRIMAVAPDVYEAQNKVMSVVGAFKQFNTTNLNGFSAKQFVADSSAFWDVYATREFEDEGLVLNIEELASLYHLPNITVETPNIAWTRAKKGEPPGNLPLVDVVPANIITRIGKTNFRNMEKEFGIKLADRRRHMYVIGKSGTGKSTLLENMAIDDIREGRGIILVDPHGEFYEHVLANIPESRINDVILFDPADRDHPVGFNLLENVDDDLKGIIASGFVGIFEKMFSNSWGPRLEHILRNTVLALLDYPDSTMLGIPRMLTDKKYRDKVVEMVKDPVIRDFWETEFAGWDQKFASEATAPILNKVGQFIAASTIRNIVAQPKSTFDVRKVMDEGKILLINLSRGKIGEDNSAMLGAMMITKIQLAAMSRADIPEADRTDSYLYVDEFQNFATNSFATILSEARKYHLDVTMANQYVAQMPEEVQDAVFGNVGTIVAFRVGAADASTLVQEFTPTFTEVDLVNQDIHRIYIKLSIDGLTGNSFSANTLPPIGTDASYSLEIIEHSRETYSRPRAEVEAQIASTTGNVARQGPSAIQEGTINLPAIKLNPSQIINGVYYREVHAKGGVRWWEGLPIDEVVADEEKKRQKFLAKKVEYLKKGQTMPESEAASLLSGGLAEARQAGEKELPPPTQVPLQNELPAPDRASVQNELAAPKPQEMITAPEATQPDVEKREGELSQNGGEGESQKRVESQPQPHTTPQNSGSGTRPDDRPNNREVKPFEYRAAQNSSQSEPRKNFVDREGSRPGEGVQMGHSELIRSLRPDLGRSKVFPESPHIAQKNSSEEQISTYKSSEKSLRSDAGQLSSAAHQPNSQPLPQAIPEPREAQVDAQISPDRAQDPLQGPTSPVSTQSSINDRPKSILQHFMDHPGSMDHPDQLKDTNTEEQEDSSKEAPQSATQPPYNPDELEEGVPYTFS